MGKTAIVVDSNSGITQQQGKELGITVLSMPFFINGEVYFEDVTLTQQDFYRRLKEDADISTSQPSPADVVEMWDKLLEDHDAVVHIPMSSGLSGSYETAAALSANYDGKVQVVNNQRISITQRQSVLEALELVKTGKTAQEVKEILEDESLEASIYLGVDTLRYLKKGGRVTPAAAAIGTVLNLKPVLEIQGEKLDAFAKARGWKNAKKIMLDAMNKDITERFGDSEVHLMLAHSQEDEETALEWKKEVEDYFPGYEIYMNPLSLSVVCHTGPGVLAIGCTKKIL